MSRKALFEPTFIKVRGRSYEWVFHCRKSAYVIYKRAILLGVIKKAHVCEECTSIHSIHAHHDDYAYPLRVRYLCSKCHTAWHSRYGAGKNRDSFHTKKKFKFDGLFNSKQIDETFEEIYEEAKERPEHIRPRR